MMQLIHTKIVPAGSDVFWALPERVLSLKPRRVAVLTGPVAPESPEMVRITAMLEKGCRLCADDYHLIEIGAEEQLSWALLRAQLTAEAVILCGIQPFRLGMAATLVMNRVNYFQDCAVIPTFSLGQLSDQKLREDLWQNALKDHFAQR